MNKTKEELIKMYIDSLNEGEIPWRKRWINGTNINGMTRVEYKGVNQLLLTLIAVNEHYEDPRWFTYTQIKQKGYKLVNAKGKGVPIEFWSVNDLKNKKNISFLDYEKIIEQNPDDKVNYRVLYKTTTVFNAAHVEGLPKIESNIKNMNNITTPKFIINLIHNLGVKYSEYGDGAFYRPSTDEIVLPPKYKFKDEYSYFATQLHELCHSTGNEKRLNRNLCSKNEDDYAREELIAEISSSFLMQKLNINVKAEHYDNHKAYIKGWINILSNQPDELFKAIKESNKVCDFMVKNSKTKEKKFER